MLVGAGVSPSWGGGWSHPQGALRDETSDHLVRSPWAPGWACAHKGEKLRHADGASRGSPALPACSGGMASAWAGVAGHRPRSSWGSWPLPPPGSGARGYAESNLRPSGAMGTVVAQRPCDSGFRSSIARCWPYRWELASPLMKGPARVSHACPPRFSVPVSAQGSTLSRPPARASGLPHT